MPNRPFSGHFLVAIAAAVLLAVLLGLQATDTLKLPFHSILIDDLPIVAAVALGAVLGIVLYIGLGSLWGAIHVAFGGPKLDERLSSAVSLVALAITATAVFFSAWSIDRAHDAAMTAQDAVDAVEAAAATVDGIEENAGGVEGGTRTIEEDLRAAQQVIEEAKDAAERAEIAATTAAEQASIAADEARKTREAVDQ